MDFKGRLALRITGFKGNGTAKELRVQTFSESQQNKSKNNAYAYSFKKFGNNLISDGSAYYGKQRKHQDISGPDLLTAVLQPCRKAHSSQLSRAILPLHTFARWERFSSWALPPDALLTHTFQSRTRCCILLGPQ